MKKVKVIFPDGSVAEIDESELSAALSAGAKRHTEKSTTMVFKDGSVADISDNDLQGALSAGAVKKKVTEATPVDTKIGGTVGASNGQSESLNPDWNNNPLNPANVSSFKKKEFFPKPEISEEDKLINDKFVNIDDKVELSGLTKKYSIPAFGSNGFNNIKKAAGLEELVVEDKKSYRPFVPEINEVTSLENNLLTKQSEAKNKLFTLTAVDKDYAKTVDELKSVEADLKKAKIIKNKLSAELAIEGEDVIDATIRTDESGNLLNKTMNRLMAISPTTAAYGAVGLSLETQDRIDKLPPQFVTGLNYYKNAEPVIFQRITDALNKGLPISESQVANITQQGLEIEQARLQRKLNNKEIEPDAYNEKVLQLNTVRKNNLLDNQETLRAFLSDGAANILDEIGKSKQTGSDIINPLGNYAFGHTWNYDDKEIKIAAEKYAKENGLDPQDGRIQSAIKYLQDNEGAMIMQNSVAKSGGVRELFKGLATPIRGISGSIEDLGKTSNDVYAESQSQGNVNVSEKRLKAEDTGVRGVVNDVVKGTGEFVTQAGLAYLTSGAVGAAGRAVLGRAGVAALEGNVAVADMTATDILGKTLLGTKDGIATFITSYAQSYDSNLKNALSYTSDNALAKRAATINSTLEGATELFLSPLDIAKGITKKFASKGTTEELLKILSDKNLTQNPSKLRDYLSKTIKGISGTAYVAGAEIGEEYVTQIADYVTNSYLNPNSESFQNRDLQNELAVTAYQTGLSMAIPALLNGVGAANANTFSKGSLLIAAQNRQKLIESLDEDLALQNIDQNEYNKKVQIVNTAAVANAELPVKADGNKLDTDEKADYVFSRVSEAVMEEKIKNSKDEAEKRILEGKIKEQQDFRTQLLGATKPVEENTGNQQAEPIKIQSAVIEIGGKTYEGKNHAEAILNAQKDGQDISGVDRQAEGKFKLSDGTIIDRAEAKIQFGQDRSELLIEQDDAANQANKDYAKINLVPALKQKLSNVKVESDADLLPYAIDKVAEAPTKLKADLGDDLFNQVLTQVPTAKLQENLDYLLANNEESVDIPVLDGIIAEREKVADVPAEVPQLSGKESVEGKPLTKEAEDLINRAADKSIGDRPDMISPALVKIAKDNGVEITDKTTPDDILKTLKERQEASTVLSRGDVKVTDENYKDIPSQKLEYKDGTAFVHKDNEGGKEHLFISRLDVTDKGKGTGSEFLTKIENYAKENNLDQIATIPETDASRKFFEKNGFVDKDGMMYKDLPKDQSLSSNTPSKEQATKTGIKNEEAKAAEISDTQTGDSTPKPETGEAGITTETGDEGGKEPPPEIVYETEKDEPKKVRSVYKNVIERSKLTKEQKELLKADPSALYTVLPNDKAKQIALDIIKEMGVENAVAEATRKNSALEPVEKVMVLGAAMDYYAGLAKDAAKAKNENAVQENSELEIDANEKMQEVARTLAGYGTDFGRAINIFNEIYKLSNLALERKLKNTVAKINEIRNPQAGKDAKVVEAIVKDDKGVVNGIGNEMTEAEIGREADLNKKVAELENDVKDLREQIKNLQNANTGSKNNPLKIKRTTDATEYDKRMKEFKSRQRTGISKDDLNDLTYFGLYHLENGATKFAEWVKIMAQKFNGFREYLEGIYHNIKQDAISKGADKDLFDTETETQKHLQDLQKTSDARKIANATKRLATANLRKAQENNPDNARIKAPIIAAERIRKDAEKNLDLPTTKNEQTYLKKLVQVVQNKAREYYKEKKETVKNVNDWLSFAIANGKADHAIWERTQEAVESQIDADKNLTDEQKEEVKDFLSDYQDSIFETLLTTSQKEEIIRQKLIEAGFGTDRTVNGKIIKAVDWNKVIGNAKNIKDAKAAIVKSITDLGYTPDEASNEINSILTDFDNKVADKKTKAINSFLNKGVINKAKNALGLNRKSKVQKLIDMNNKGVLDDVRVKDVLAKDLGIISLTETDLSKVRELSEKIDNAIVPFIKKKYEEQLQYLFDSKSGNIVYLENREFVMNNRLTSLWNQIQNLTGYLRVLSTYIATSIKTGNPVGMAKVFRKQWKDGVSDALTVLMGGHVSRGTAFSDLTRSTEGEARVRYLEQGKGKLLGLPDLYLRAAGKTWQINPINALYRKIKYVGRLMESADTIPSNVISGLTQYWQIQKQVKLLNPELNSKQVETKAYEIMYSIDSETAKAQAVKDLKESGIDTPTRYEVNRASHEIVERKRNELISKEFYDKVDELKPTAEEKLKQQGNDNPTDEQIVDEVYNILGRDEPLDIVARGERQALRETGKKSTAGITSVLLWPVDGLQQVLKKQMLGKHGAFGKTTANVADAAFNQLLPFANSIGRWIEMGLELTPYGVVKGVGYKGYAEVTKQTGNKKLNPIELHELGDDYIIRGIQGTAVTLAAMFLVGMLKGDDDDEDIVTGTYQGKDFKKERIKQIGNPQRSLDIGGRKFPLDLLGAAAYPLMMYSDFLDRRTDENERHGVLYTTAAIYLNTAGQSAYGRLDQYGSIFTDIFNSKEDKYLPKMGKISGSYLGAQFIPFNRFQQEIGELWNPKSTTSITFGENLLQQFSMVGGFMKDHPAFDYRGREYDKGDIWVGSPDGIVKMFTKSKTADEIDSELARIDFAASDAYRETRDEENYKYTIENEDGTRRFMTPQEYYEFKRETGNGFNEKLVINFETIKNVVITDTKGEYDEKETLKVQREAYSELLTKSKENALALIQAGTGHIPNADLNKAEKKEESKNVSTQKKQQVVLIND